jgi:hypothetical protein
VMVAVYVRAGSSAIGGGAGHCWGALACPEPENASQAIPANTRTIAVMPASWMLSGPARRGAARVFLGRFADVTM